MARGLVSSMGRTFRPWAWVPQVPIGNPVTSPYWLLAWVPPALWDAPKRLWAYELDFAQPKTPDFLGSGALQVQFISVQEGRGFLLTGISGLKTLGNTNPEGLVWGSGNLVNNATALIVQLTGARGPWFSLKVPFDNIAGAGGQAPGLPTPVYLAGGETVGVQAQSLGGGGLVPVRWRLTFAGVLFT